MPVAVGDKLGPYEILTIFPPEVESEGPPRYVFLLNFLDELRRRAFHLPDRPAQSSRDRNPAAWLFILPSSCKQLRESPRWAKVVKMMNLPESATSA